MLQRKKERLGFQLHLQVAGEDTWTAFIIRILHRCKVEGEQVVDKGQVKMLQSAKQWDEGPNQAKVQACRGLDTWHPPP